MLTDLQRKKLLHYFKVLDFDRNGYIEIDDFHAIAENLVILWHVKPTDPEHQRIMNSTLRIWHDIQMFVDENNDEIATTDEWLKYADNRIVNCSEAEYDEYVNKLVRDLFDFFDTNNDNLLSLDEYLDLFMAFRLEARHAAKGFLALDRNHDEYISKPELIKGVREFLRSNNTKSKGNLLFGPFE